MCTWIFILGGSTGAMFEESDLTLAKAIIKFKANVDSSCYLSQKMKIFVVVQSLEHTCKNMEWLNKFTRKSFGIHPRPSVFLEFVKTCVYCRISFCRLPHNNPLFRDYLLNSACQVLRLVISQEVPCTSPLGLWIVQLSQIFHFTLESIQPIFSNIMDAPHAKHVYDIVSELFRINFLTLDYVHHVLLELPMEKRKIANYICYELAEALLEKFIALDLTTLVHVDIALYLTLSSNMHLKCLVYRFLAKNTKLMLHHEWSLSARLNRLFHDDCNYKTHCSRGCEILAKSRMILSRMNKRNLLAKLFDIGMFTHDEKYDAIVRFDSLASNLLGSVPSHLKCPITMCIFVQPVVCSDGNTYEQSAITRWLNSCDVTSPTTREYLSSTFYYNRSIASQIDEFNIA